MICAEVKPKISVYHDGELEPGQRDRVASHLANCPDCTEYLRDLGLIGTLLRSDRACEVPDRLWGRITAAIDRAKPSRLVGVRGWLPRAAAVAAGFVLYLLGYGAMTSSPQADGTRSFTQAEQIERVLHETGLALAGNWPSSQRRGLFEHRPEARLFREFSKDTGP